MDIGLKSRSSLYLSGVFLPYCTSNVNNCHDLKYLRDNLVLLEELKKKIQTGRALISKERNER